MKVSTPDGGPPLLPQDIYPIPPGAPFKVIAEEFRIDPSTFPSYMSESDFIRDWGALQFVAEYEGKTYKESISAEKIKELLRRAHPEPKPRVTRRR
jgi:hypothetical protein